MNQNIQDSITELGLFGSEFIINGVNQYAWLCVLLNLAAASTVGLIGLVCVIISYRDWVEMDKQEAHIAGWAIASFCFVLVFVLCFKSVIIMNYPEAYTLKHLLP